jgi:nitrate reductase alpha subunit
MESNTRDQNQQDQQSTRQVHVKKQVYLDLQTEEELRLCQLYYGKHFGIASKPEPYGRVAKRLIYENADRQVEPGSTLRPLSGKTKMYHFVLDEETMTLLGQIALRYQAILGEYIVPKDTRVKNRVSPAAVLRHLISRKAQSIHDDL